MTHTVSHMMTGQEPLAKSWVGWSHDM